MSRASEMCACQTEPPFWCRVHARGVAVTLNATSDHTIHNEACGCMPMPPPLTVPAACCGVCEGPNGCARLVERVARLERLLERAVDDGSNNNLRAEIIAALEVKQ